MKQPLLFSGGSMTTRISRGLAAVLLSLIVLPPAALAQSRTEALVNAPEEQPEPAALRQEPSHPFAAIAGAWTGGGSIALTGDINERLRCRANHTYGQANSSLALNIRCASDNYKIELISNVTERRGQVTGQWRETNYNVTGTINGRVAGNRVSAVAEGDKFTADLTVVTTGNRQTIRIQPKATYLQDVQIALSRQAPAAPAKPATAAR
jgi:hypothetical protein